MTTSFTADQHFDHRNVIGCCGRPFHSVGEMNAVLVANETPSSARTTPSTLQRRRHGSAGGSDAVVTDWIKDVQGERLAAEADLAACAPPAVLTAADVRRLIKGLRDVATALSEGDPARHRVCSRTCRMADPCSTPTLVLRTELALVG